MILNGRCAGKPRSSLAKSGDEGRLVSEYAGSVMVRMPRLPVRQNEHPRPQFANHRGDLLPIFESVFDAAVGNVERFAPPDAQNLSRIFGFTRPVLHGAAGSHLAARKIEDGGGAAHLRHLQQRTAAGLLHIVAVSGDGKNVH